MKTKTVAPATFCSVIKTTTIKTVIEQKESQKKLLAPCETCGKPKLSTIKCDVGAIAANPPPRQNRRQGRKCEVQQRDNLNKLDESVQAAARNLN